MSPFPDDLTPAEQDPDPDSPEPGQAAHAVWVTPDKHHFDHNIADQRWADVLTGSQQVCMSLTDLLAHHLSPEATTRLEVSVLWTDDDHIAALNSQFRQKPGPTNILSFPSGEGLCGQTDELFLGDLVLGYETVKTEAAEAGKPMSHHVAHLLVHGLLHLAGYDHVDEEEAVEMEALETSLLAQVGIADPYCDPDSGAEAMGPDRSAQT